MINQPQESAASALAILHSCGLHPKYYDTVEKAAVGVREIITSLRQQLADPPHDVQCLVLKNLGIEGYTGDEPPKRTIIACQTNR